ncbi:MAG: catalase-related domain-containing protein, partial [Bacteroidota bacterium]|nr:catalase-related domain-containing protein [Bacteroidota bacterium]
TALDGVSEPIVQRQLGHFYKADPAYGKGVEDAIKAMKTGVDPNSNVLPQDV